jgi:hypothetical protein
MLCYVTIWGKTTVWKGEEKQRRKMRKQKVDIELGDHFENVVYSLLSYLIS